MARRRRKAEQLRIEVIQASGQTAAGVVGRALDLVLAAARRAEAGRQAEEAEAKLLARGHAPLEENSATDAEKEEPPRRGPSKDSPIGGVG